MADGTNAKYAEWLTLKPLGGGLMELVLHRGKVNALSYEFMGAVLETLSALDSDRDVSCVLLTSGVAGIFSAGLDVRASAEYFTSAAGILKWRERVGAFMRYPLAMAKPIAAVVDGTALAGGMLLACACDFASLGSEKAYKVGVTEAAMGMPFPRMPFAVLNHAIADKRGLRTFAYVGTEHSAAEAHALGFGHALCATPREPALAWLRAVSAQRNGVFTINKRHTNAPFFAAIQDPDPALNLALQSPLDFDQSISKTSAAGFFARGKELAAKAATKHGAAAAAAAGAGAGAAKPRSKL